LRTNDKSKPSKMRVFKERIDENAGLDEDAKWPLCQTGIVFTFAQAGSKIIIRIEDRNLTIGRLLAPQDWYIDLFESDFFCEVATYLRRNTQVRMIEAYRAMSGGVYQHDIGA
jgi:hypothetical protein